VWWRDAVIYQIYPRSFQDSDGDGIGDLRGIVQRLDHPSYLGVDALWLSPIYPSPLADFGYDVSDYTAVDPVFGTLADFDALVQAAHARGLKLLMDLVPCHTSIEHPWFREHADWYVWADGGPDGGPPNNWVSPFGGSAWTRDERSGRWYLHSFYPEQPDLDWRNPDVVRAMQSVVRFWIDRGVDGFRLDAIEHLLKDPELHDDPPATEPYPLPRTEEEQGLSPVHSRNSPDIGKALAALREAAGDALLIGEVHLPTAQLALYLDHLDLVFAFEVFHSGPDPDRLRQTIEASARLVRHEAPGAAWVLSNHDFPRLPTRFGRENKRAAAMLLLTLPGTAFVYQGDEIGMADGPGADAPYDRAGRDAHRHPMQWDASPTGGFTDGDPWLPPIDPTERNVADQAGDPRSLLNLYRELIALRRELGDGLRMVDAAPGVLAYERGEHVVAVNMTDEPCPALRLSEPVLETQPGAVGGRTLSPHGGAVWLQSSDRVE
jgi:alpha-glucosidase